MDPAGVGALIGISMMLCVFGCSVLYSKREKMRKLFARRKKKSPLEPKETTVLLQNPTHVKMKNVLPPLKVKAIFLNRL